MSKHFSKTEFAYPVERICGKISRHSKVIHACTPSGKQITYLQGERNYLEHPKTVNETKAHDLFKRRLLVVSARYNHRSETYAADMADYRAARLAATTPEQKEATKSFQAYLWSLAKSDITE